MLQKVSYKTELGRITRQLDTETEMVDDSRL